MIKNEIIGRRFGRLVVVSSATPDKNNLRKWLCQCDCGKQKIIYEKNFCRGKTKSCGCYSREATKNRMSHGWSEIITKDYLIENHIVNKISLRQIAKNLGCSLGCIKRYMDNFELNANDLFYDIVGKKFGNLTVDRFAYTRDGSSYWHVQCDCGTLKVVKGSSLVRCSIVSCGCWNKKKSWKGVGDLSRSYFSRLVKGAIKRNIEMSLTIENAWDLFEKQNGICALSGRFISLDRCYGTNKSKINGHKQTASLDRIDSSLGYSIGNVQWVHIQINIMKMNSLQLDFIQLCKDVADFNK